MPVKGAKEYKMFKRGEHLTRKQALVAKCYECNGFSMEDCLGVSCPLYQWSPTNKSAKFHPLKSQKPYPVLKPVASGESERRRCRGNKDLMTKAVVESEDGAGRFFTCPKLKIMEWY